MATSRCSFDIAGTSGLEEDADVRPSEYIVCPFDARVCGAERNLILTEDGAEQELTSLDNPKSSDFIFGQVCSYEIEWPETASENDEIMLQVV